MRVCAVKELVLVLVLVLASVRGQHLPTYLTACFPPEYYSYVTDLGPSQGVRQRLFVQEINRLWTGAAAAAAADLGEYRPY